VAGDVGVLEKSDGPDQGIRCIFALEFGPPLLVLDKPLWLGELQQRQQKSPYSLIFQGRLHQGDKFLVFVPFEEVLKNI
jgi:hypothetical protein